MYLKIYSQNTKSLLDTYQKYNISNVKRQFIIGVHPILILLYIIIDATSDFCNQEIQKKYDKPSLKDLNEHLEIKHKFSPETHLNKILNYNFLLNFTNRQINYPFNDNLTFIYKSEIKNIDSLEDIQKLNKEFQEKKINFELSKDSINNKSKIILMNYLNLKLKWEQEFYTDEIKKYNFKNSRGQRIEIEFLNKNDYLFYYEDHDYIMFEKTLYGGFKMLFVKHKNARNFNTFNIDFCELFKKFRCSKTKETSIEISIPKFKIQDEINIKEVLIEQDINILFDKTAQNFSKMVTADYSYVENFKQNISFEINESGISCESTTVVCILCCDGSGPNKQIKLDETFNFILSDNKDKIIIAGQYDGE